jgi:hypothetical protein
MLIQSRGSLPFMPQGDANKTNSPTLYAPGELGYVFSDQSTGRTHQRVQLDSGATAASAVGIVAVGQLAFWKDIAAFIVTNDKNQCDVGPTGAINRIAGIFPVAATAGYYCDIIRRGKAVPCVSDNSGVKGGTALADTTASVARVVGSAAVNTAPVSQVIGINVSTPANATVNVDVNIGGFDGT